MLGHICRHQVVGHRCHQVQPRLSKLPLDAGLHGHAAAAVRRHRHLRSFPCRLGGEQFRHVRLGTAGFSGVKARRGLPAHQRGCLRAHEGAGDRELDALVGADGLSEHDPFASVGDRPFDEPARIADAFGGDQDALRVEAVEHLPEAGALIADERVGGEVKIGDEHRVRLMVDHGLDRS